MSKLAGLACTSMFLLLFARPHSDKFSKYKTVEAYEISPGILMMPRYSADGQVCEIGLEKWLYSPKEVILDSTFSRKEIDQIVDELVPASERGPRITELGAGNMIDQVGNTVVTNAEYENISTHVYSIVLPTSTKKKLNVRAVVATIQWKNRTCQ